MGSKTYFYVTPVGWEKRPKIVPPASKTDIIIEAIALIGVLLSIFIVIINAVNLSDIIPSRYNPATFAFSAIIIYALITILNRYPYAFRYNSIVVTEENAPRLYSIGRRTLLYIKTVVVWMFLTLEWFFIVSLNIPEPSNLIGLILIVLLFSVVVVIIYIYAMIKISQEYKPDTSYRASSKIFF